MKVAVGLFATLRFFGRWHDQRHACGCQVTHTHQGGPAARFNELDQFHRLTTAGHTAIHFNRTIYPSSSVDREE